MKIYFHNYDKARQAEKLLWDTLQDISHSDDPVTTNGYFGWVKEKIEEALGILRGYIDTDGNERTEDGADVYGGFVRRLDIFDEEQLRTIRDEFAKGLDEADDANDKLDIINVCQRLLGEPEYRHNHQ